MKSKQTSYSSKEILCFYVRKHDQRASIMRKCALIIVVLMISKNVSAQVLDETTTKFGTGITYSDIPEEASTTSEVILEKENDSTSNSFSIFKSHSTPSTSNLNNLEKNGASEASKAEIHDIKINTFYNATRNKILLNISWDQPSEWENTTHFYQFKIAANSSYVECFERGNSFEIIQKNMTSSSISLPPYHHVYDLKVGCTYIVSILVHSSEGQRRKDVTYTVPECVATKCSCQYRTPQVKNLKVLQISPRKFNISWGIQNNSINNRLNISQVIFMHRQFIPNSDMRFSVPHLLANFRYEKDYFIFNDTHQIFAFGKSYQLLATFRTLYNCQGKTHTNFTVLNAGNIPEDINETNKTTKSLNRSSNSLEIALLVILLSFGFVTVIYLLRRNRLVLKELVLNPFALRFTRHGRHRQDLRNSYIMVPTITKRQQEINMLYVDKEIIDGNVDHYEFPRTRIELLKEIGEGAFGQVFKAKAFGIREQPGYTYVAVKKLREGAPPDEMDDFLSEIEILKKVREHPNIISMFGCCVLKEPYLMVMEFVPCGDLKRYLLDLREKWIKKKRSRNDSTPVFSDSSDGAYVSPDSPRSRLTSDRPSVTETEYTTLGSDGLPTPTELYNDKIECTLDHTELQNFALQIARGMEHLEKIPIAHRDLAARNILINEFKTLKISDFGLSRIGPYVNIKKKKLPLRWMSIESIEDHFYDSKSDVWSFAVVLWEIGTLGAFPYENVPDAVVPHYLASGNRLPRPEICTDELYSLMLKCWSHETQLRPSFQELVELLDVKRRRIYVDFNQLNPLYVFPPSELPEHDKNLNSPV